LQLLGGVQEPPLFDEDGGEVIARFGAVRLRSDEVGKRVPGGGQITLAQCLYAGGERVPAGRTAFRGTARCAEHDPKDDC